MSLNKSLSSGIFTLTLGERVPSCMGTQENPLYQGSVA